jgi:acyl-CoA hydrolase
MVEDVAAGTHRHVASAYLTFVALDRNGQRIHVPQILPETGHQKRRYEDAGRRREMRQPEMARKKEIRSTLAAEWHV